MVILNHHCHSKQIESALESHNFSLIPVVKSLETRKQRALGMIPIFISAIELECEDFPKRVREVVLLGYAVRDFSTSREGGENSALTA